jgi:hypothetical protein
MDLKITQVAGIVPTTPKTKALFARFSREYEKAKSSGNYAFVTTSGLRVAVCSGCAENVHDYLLKEMGIRGDVKTDHTGILIGFGRFSHHSHATVLRALQGEFRVVCAMTEDGRQALKIFLPEPELNPKRNELSENTTPP